MQINKVKVSFNKTDWLIISVYSIIVFAVSFIEVEKEHIWASIFETFNLLLFTILPVFIIMKYIFPVTIEQGRIIKFFLLGMVVLPIIGYFEFWGIKLIYNHTWDMANPIFFYHGLVSQSENIGVLLSLLVAKRFFETKINLTTLEKEMKTNELKMLTSQIDPHFLFNNLNTVDTLIDTNPSEAKKYLNELSKLYRYLLSTKDEEVVPLMEELDFIKHYIYLIKTRFGDAFTFAIDISSEIIEHTLIPPGALQGLIENAVKHNMGTPIKPIAINIMYDDNYIVVSNNFVERTEKLESTGNGLENINARYKLLAGKEILITSGDQFTVKLPIIHELN